VRVGCVVAIALTACAGVVPKQDLRARAVGSFLDAVKRHDARAIEAELGEAFTYAGLYFRDPACAKQFSAAREIPRSERAEFARCLAELPLVASTRHEMMFGVSVLEYAPGIEVEIAFRFDDDRRAIRWIGYSGRRDGETHPPTITKTWLEANRIEGDPKASPTADEVTELARDRSPLLKRHSAWLHVCIGPNGAVIGVRPLEISSVRAEAAFSSAVRGWRFNPFLLGGRASPVCALLVFFEPAFDTKGKEGLPLAIAAPEGALRVPGPLIQPINDSFLDAGFPTQSERTWLRDRGVLVIRLGFRYCADQQGNASEVLLLEPSGVPRIDAVHERRIRTWKFNPYLVDGKPVKACSAYFWSYKI
jgi:hypothetical protein